MDQAECLSLVTLLESRGVLELKRAKDTRLTKVGGAALGTDSPCMAAPRC